MSDAELPQITFETTQSFRDSPVRRRRTAEYRHVKARSPAGKGETFAFAVNFERNGVGRFFHFDRRPLSHRHTQTGIKRLAVLVLAVMVDSFENIFFNVKFQIE